MPRNQKTYFKNNKQTLAFLIVLISAVVFLCDDNYAKKQSAIDGKLDLLEEIIPVQCEKGVWTEFPDLLNSSQYKKFSSEEKLNYNNNKNIFVGTINTNKLFVTDKNYSLDFFRDRDVQVEGYGLENNNIYIKKIKCVGIEADKNIIQSRKALMNYMQNNINKLAIEKAPQNDWQVETFYFVNNTDVYVQYETTGSILGESPYASRLWLVQVSDMNKAIPSIRTLAYIQEDAEDPLKNIIKQGVDLYKDVKNLTIYEFDANLKQWVLQ